MNLKLVGSINNHSHLFKLVQLLTYFVIQKRKKDINVQCKDVLQSWLDPEKINLHSGMIESLDAVVMFFVNSCVYEEKHHIELFGLQNAKEIKDEILNIIKEYWLPF